MEETKSRIRPVEISEGIFDQIEEEYALFEQTIRRDFAYYSHHIAGCEPDINNKRLNDTWQAYCHDKKNTSNSLHPSSATPDHFKLCGILVFWLRRFSPIYGIRQLAVPPGSYAQSEEMHSIFYRYTSEFLAFNLGLEICAFFEKHREKTACEPDILLNGNLNYLETVCYMMKFKNLSPHSMGLVYRSLFIPLRAVYSA